MVSNMKENNLHEKILESDWLRVVQFLVNTVQKGGNVRNAKRRIS